VPHDDDAFERDEVASLHVVDVNVRGELSTACEKKSREHLTLPFILLELHLRNYSCRIRRRRETNFGGVEKASGEERQVQRFSEEELPWAEEALCAYVDPDVFFPEKGGSSREAKRICAQCAVRDECLDYALANDERFGIWGGLSERERRRFKRKLAS
jgi:WhiB family transcriptional regulator, redox-sensing transcriptional regulator